MEVASALVLCQRSLQKHNFRYSTILCDGDAKTLATLNKEEVYGPDVTLVKEDCINHVAKRMYKGIEVCIIVIYIVEFLCKNYFRSVEKSWRAPRTPSVEEVKEKSPPRSNKR
jgi:hypothetical protein